MSLRRARSDTHVAANNSLILDFVYILYIVAMHCISPSPCSLCKGSLVCCVVVSGEVEGLCVVRLRKEWKAWETPCGVAAMARRARFLDMFDP